MLARILLVYYGLGAGAGVVYVLARAVAHTRSMGERRSPARVLLGRADLRRQLARIEREVARLDEAALRQRVAALAQLQSDNGLSAEHPRPSTQRLDRPTTGEGRA